MAAFTTYQARLLGSLALSRDTKHLEFEMLGVQRFGFAPGQWLSLKLERAQGEEIVRAYSIASPPGPDNHFALCANRVPSGAMSNHLYDLEPGEEICCQGPFGDFILRPPLRDTIFIATGTGIAPFRSILHWLLSEPARLEGRELWLVFGNRTEQDIYYHDEFSRLAREHAALHYLPTLSRPAPDWTGLRGRVQEHVTEIARGRADMDAYVCGLEKMVKQNRELLKALGWDRRAIRYENYD
jgi:ferredoxin-NADP reductase